MARIVTVVVETGKDLFSCFMANDSRDLKFLIIGDGKTARAAVDDFFVARDEMKEFYEEQGEEFPDLEFRFVFDVGAFFSYYPLSITAFAKYIGMNPSLLRQYASGLKEPKGKSLEKIRKGIQQVVGDINADALITKPVLAYT